MAGVLISAIVLFIGVCVADAADQPSQNKASREKPPRLETGSTRIDLKAAREGEILSACFELKNGGEQPLKIRKVKSGCRCTHADYPEKLLSGEKAELCLTIDTLGVHGKRIFKSVVYTSDPARPSVALRVKADIAPMVTITPDRVFFRDAAGKDLEMEIFIETSRDKPLEVHLESHDLEDRISVTLDPVVEGRRYRLWVKNNVTVPGAYRGRVMLKTDHPGRERVAVPVFAHLTAPVAVYPSRLILGTGRCPACRAGGIYTGEIIVRAHDEKPLRVISAGPDKEGLTCRVESLVAERAYRIGVQYVVQENTSLPDELKIITNRDELGTIGVPVRLKD